MKCQKVEILISAYLDGEVTASRWQEAQTHIGNCTGCAAVFAKFQKQTVLLKKDLQQEEPAAHLWAGIAARIRHMPASSPARRIWQGWKQRLSDFLVTPPPSVRWAQTAVVAAVVVIVLALQLRRQPDSQLVNLDSAHRTQLSEADLMLRRDFDPAGDKQRILQASTKNQIERYFEKAGLLLLEVKNGVSAQEQRDLSAIRTASQSLLEETILIKEDLKNTDLAILKNTVDKLEMVLFDIANLNERPETEEVELLKATIVDQDLLIKIEIYDLSTLDKTGSLPEVDRKNRPPEKRSEI